MIDKLLQFGEASSDDSSFLDVGCGIGGSSRYLCKRAEGASGVGITLSTYQARRGRELSKGYPLHFSVMDAQKMLFPTGRFDMVWSLEAAEHVPDKAKLFREMKRVVKPGGKVIVAAWCKREGTDLTEAEVRRLEKIGSTYCLPAEWASKKDMVSFAEACGLTDVKAEDWTKRVLPFWKSLILRALHPLVLPHVLSDWTTLKGALASRHVLMAQKKGLVRFVVLVGTG